MLLVLIIVAVGAALTLLVGVAMNLYAEALMSRYPQTMELLRRKPFAAAVMIGLLILAGSVLPTVRSLSSSKSGDKTAAPNSPSQHSSTRNSAIAVPESATPAPNTPSANAAISPQPPSATRPPDVRYDGEITIVTDAKDLDQAPPAKVEEEDGGDFHYNFLNGEIYADGEATFAVWRNEGKPSYFDCTDRAVAASMNSLDLKVGDTVCARTSEGRTVRMKVTRHCDGYCAIFDAIIWELP
jgi:hypothetical protein